MRFCFGPFGPTGQPDPTIIQTAPKPDFAFLWIYAVLAYLPPSLETPVLFIAPVVGIGAMLLLPLVAGEGEKHWSRRPVAVLMVPSSPSPSASSPASAPTRRGAPS